MSLVLTTLSRRDAASFWTLRRQGEPRYKSQRNYEKYLGLDLRYLVYW